MLEDYDPPLRPTSKGTTNIERLICRNKDTKNDTCKGDCSIASVGYIRYVCFANPAWVVARFPFFIAFLNPEEISICEITGGISSQILGPI